MRKINIEYVPPGGINAKNIYSLSNKLISRGSKIKSEYKNKLKKMGIRYIYIEDDLSEGIQIQDMISEDIHLQAKDILINNYNLVQSGKKIVNTRDISKVVGNIVDNIFYADNVIVNLTDIRVREDYIFNHSVNVCVLSIAIGIKLGLNDSSLLHLGIGAFLHDIGVSKIPTEIIKKPSRLTEDEIKIVRKHTEHGFNVLKECNSLNRNAVYVALGHHEWYNGTGYPKGFSNGQIHQYARIVSVADVFDAMTSDRVYGRGSEPFKVVEYLKLMKECQFDGKIVDEFINSVVLYPNGTGVVLNTNEIGIVVNSSLGNRTKPIVRIVVDPFGNRYSIFNEIDLSKNEDYYITGINNEF